MYSVRVRPNITVIYNGIIYEPSNEYTLIAEENELPYFEKVFTIIEKKSMEFSDKDNSIEEEKVEEPNVETTIKRRRGRTPKNP